MTMAIRRFFIGLIAASVFVIGIWIFGSVPQATAETLNFKTFTHVMKSETFPIPDAEGHLVSSSVREGVWIFESGELGWLKSIINTDTTKGTGNMELYTICNFQDGSTLVLHSKGTQQATSAGVPSGVKRTGEIIHGTGRFQGVKGTYTTSSKMFPPEKGELGGKSLVEGTLVYNLPGK
jgi:hypothetical protein